MSSPTTPRALLIEERGRRKAYRPMAPAERHAAREAALAAYARGDYFAAHELLEPAWLGTADPSERALASGIIKLAAAYVHAVRGNPTGTEKNLRGARQRLLDGTAAAGDAQIDVIALVEAIDARLVGSAVGASAPPIRRLPR